MRFLLTNDDGWDADGLGLMRRVAEEFGEVYIVAPLDNQTGVGHQVTVRRPLRLKQIEEMVIAVDGTPADCVRIGLKRWPIHFDWVFSGINNGANMGVDVFSSGTVAAAREATFHGRNAAAFSQYRQEWARPVSTQAVLSHVRRLVAMITQWPSQSANGGVLHWPRAQFHETGVFLININLPDFGAEGMGEDVVTRTCGLDLSPPPAEFKETPEGFVFCGKFSERARVTGHDIDVCMSGDIALTHL